MKTATAITKAMKNFKRDLPKADIRTVKLLEGIGCDDDWSILTIGIEYAIDGDYTQSDKFPYQTTVFASEVKR